MSSKINEENKLPITEMLKTLVFFAVSVSIVIFIAKKIDSLFLNEKTEVLPVVRRESVTCDGNYTTYQKLSENPLNGVDLISNETPMYAEGGAFKSKVVITKIETDKSKIACGYLYVEAGTKTSGALQGWENLYINPKGFGGHINDENNIGPGDGATTSQYLFSLSKINYWKTRNDRNNEYLQTADWAVLLNVSDVIEFEIGLNTEDKTGFINKFSIVYKCWNPQTGEENHDCKIQVTNKSL